MKGFVRPDAVVLPESAMVPDENIIKPAPNQFTHELTRPQPFHFGVVDEGRPPNGEFPAGTLVVLLFHDGGPRCRVADARGLYVEVDYEALQPIPAGK